MPALISAIGWLVAKIFGDNVIRFIAGKAMLTALFVVVLPLVLNNFLYDIIQALMTWVNGQISSNSIDASNSFTGLAAWLINRLRLPECLSVLVSALTLKTILRHVPFLRL